MQKPFEHKITHYYQPTNNSCNQSAMATLLSFFGQSMTPEQVMADIPVHTDEKGDDWGTINQQLATWCISQGFTVEMYTADFEIIDLSWADLGPDSLLERMELAKTKRNIPSLGKAWSEIYVQSYIDFIKAGGKLHIQPYMTTKLLDSLLPQSPLLLCVCYNVLYTAGRSKSTSLRASDNDDINGKLSNHSIVAYGKDKQGNYLVADPWKEPGFHAIEPERLLAAMTASQMECDNLLFQLSR